MTLPERQYYTLEKAVQELNKSHPDKHIDIADLIHFAAMRKLELCVRINIEYNDEDFLMSMFPLSGGWLKNHMTQTNQKTITIYTDFGSVSMQSSGHRVDSCNTLFALESTFFAKFETKILRKDIEYNGFVHLPRKHDVRISNCPSDNEPSDEKYIHLSSDLVPRNNDLYRKDEESDFIDGVISP